MIEQFLDFCRLYPAARWIRDVCDLAPGRKWRDAYEKEESIGIMLLQREKRLVNTQKKIIRYEKRQQDSAQKHEKHQELPPALLQELADIDKRLIHTRGLYYEHQLRIRRLLSVTLLDNVHSREVLMARKPQYSFITRQGDRPYIWRKHRRVCVQSGGCCSRDCGCCEAPLTSIPKEKFTMYGHCTTECGCCMKHNQFYQPHPMFEKVEGGKEREFY
jgi:hypothetical protein